MSIHKGFEVRTYYRALACKGDEMFPWKSIWKPIALTKVAFFLWADLMGKILTVENLSKRHIILMSWCCMCQGDGETVDRLLLHYLIAKELWEKVYAL